MSTDEDIPVEDKVSNAFTTVSSLLLSAIALFRIISPLFRKKKP